MLYARFLDGSLYLGIRTSRHDFHFGTNSFDKLELKELKNYLIKSNAQACNELEHFAALQEQNSRAEGDKDVITYCALAIEALTSIQEATSNFISHLDKIIDSEVTNCCSNNMPRASITYYTNDSILKRYKETFNPENQDGLASYEDLPTFMTFCAESETRNIPWTNPGIFSIMVEAPILGAIDINLSVE